VTSLREHLLAVPGMSLDDDATDDAIIERVTVLAADASLFRLRTEALENARNPRERFMVTICTDAGSGSYGLDATPEIAEVIARHYFNRDHGRRPWARIIVQEWTENGWEVREERTPRRKRRAA